jgi:hypothetical protein
VIIRADGILPGIYFESAGPTDIAPTLSALLEIDFPATTEGRILTEAFRKR